MVASGYASHGLIYLALGYAASEVPAYLTGFSEGVTVLSLSMLELIIALGGVTVMGAGLALLWGHRTIGRTLLFLGGGAGFLGVAIAFGFAVLNLGVGSALSYAAYWVGLFLAALARAIAKGIKTA